MYENVDERPPRFVELDIIRGVTIFAMIFLHLLWDLDFFQVYPLSELPLNKLGGFKVKS